MNIKASIAAAVLAASAVGVSACASSPSKDSAASTPATTAAQATASDPATTASSADSATPSDPSTPSTPPRRASGRPDIPDAAMLSVADLAPAASGTWKQTSNPVVPAAHSVDPDNCDPIARPQFDDPSYPRNPAWVNTREMSWSTSNAPQIDETVITYASAVAASADFTKHRGWIAGCAARFQWTDAPATNTISTFVLNGVANAYGIRVAMRTPGQPASAAGSQGVDYMAVILRGNSLTVVNVSGASSEQDPGANAVQHDVQVAAGKLTAVYTLSR